MTAKPTATGLPTDSTALVQLHTLMAIHDNVAYKNAMEYVDALTCITLA